MPGTKKRLLRALLDGPATAAELGEALGVSTTAARRHAEDLHGEGVVEAESEQRGLGRPNKVYRITDEGRERFPRRYDLLAERMVEAAGEDGVEDREELMRRVAGSLVEEHGHRVPSEAPLEEQVEAVAALLEALGFPTELEEAGDRYVLVRRDCIFLRAAEAHRDAVCGHLDTVLLEKLLDRPVELEACLPDGAPACRHEVRIGEVSGSG